MKRRITIFLVAIALSAVAVVFLVVAARRFLAEDHGVGVSSLRWLPSGARNITYLDVPLTMRMAEFDIEREAFEVWCTDVGRPLRELGNDESHEVSRCLLFLERRGVIAASTEPNEIGELLPAPGRSTTVLTEGDLYYSEHWSNGGGYTIGYDIEKGRGYYSYAHH